jgi:ubiquinone/menaquinone biosynthesis C-methylase UbiE
MIPLKKSAVNELGLKRGDRVIAFCCGTGQEFPFIQERIGPEGEILGVDWSNGMLERAHRRIADNGWTNVTLVKADVTALPRVWSRQRLTTRGYARWACRSLVSPKKLSKH